MNLMELAPKAAEVEGFLKALANSRRLMILCKLHDAELSVTEIQQAIGLSQSALSQHLARLREDRLVKTRRESQTIFYSLANEKVSRVISLLHELYCSEFPCAGERDPTDRKRGRAMSARRASKEQA